MKFAPRWYQHWPIWVALGVNILISVSLFAIARKRQAAVLQSESTKRAEVYASSISKSIEHNLQILDSLAAFWVASEKVSREEFRDFVAAGALLDSDIQALGWIPRVTDELRDKFEEDAQLWRSDFHFYENVDGQPRDAAKRTEYFPIYFVEPFVGNESAVGLDLAANPAWRSTLQGARDTGQAISTERTTWVDGIQSQAGILVFRPIFSASHPAFLSVDERRKELLGYALGVFRVASMVNADLGVEYFNDVHFSIVDDTESGRPETLYESEGWAASQSAIEVRLPLNMPGRKWLATFRPSRDLVARFGPQKAWGVLFVGLFFTSILIFILGFYFRRMSRDAMETERLSAELELAHSALIEVHGELEERVRSRTAELQRSNADLEQFAYVSSHDLQEPLRMVASFTGMLEEELDGKLDEDQLKYMNYILEGTSRMQELLNDLLKYSRVGSVEKELEATDTEDILDEALDNLKIAIVQSSAEISREALPTVLGDNVQLRQVFQNLISNGIKFCSGGNPKISISAAQNEQKEWIFKFSDNGIGIEKESFERIFVIFQRLHLRREYNGSGIGLAICKKIIQRHGGRIWVDATLGQGSTFYFTLSNSN